MNPDQTPLPPDPGLSAPTSLNGLFFLSVMVAPVVLTSVIVLFGATTGDLAPVIGFFGGIAAGIICGVMLGKHLGSSLGMKILLSLIFVAVMGVACVGMSCVGCVACGYKLNFH